VIYRLAVTLLLLGLAVPSGHAQGSPPVAYFEIRPHAPELGETVYFNSTSFDEDGPLVNWTWVFDDGMLLYGESVSRTFLTPGTITVQLTVEDSDGVLATHGEQFEIRSASSVGRLIPDWAYWLMPFLVSLLLLGIAYLVVSKGQPAIYNLVFFLFFTASGTKSLTEAVAVLAAQSSLEGLNAFAIVANRLISYVYAPLFLWFVLVFPRPVHPVFADGRKGAWALLLAVPFALFELTGWSAAARTNVFNVFVSLIAVGCTALLIYHSKETDSEEERRRIRFLATAFALIVIASTVVAAFNIVSTNAGDSLVLHELSAVFGLILAPVVEIVAASVLMYAVLRYQLMGIEQLIVKTTRGTLTAVLVPSAFVATSASIEQLFQTSVLSGVRFDFIIAAFIATLLMFPIQKWATFLLYRLFPGFGIDDEAEAKQRRMEIFEAQLRYSLLDGELNAKEIRLLRGLSTSIELADDELVAVAGRFPSVKLEDLRPKLAQAAQPAPA
jgi:hypothetical protein